jgi:hypothetical protein
MARQSFDMNTTVVASDVAGAKALLAKLRAQHHKDLLDIIIEASTDGAVTCTQVVEAYDAENLNEEQARIYKKYSKQAHMQYLINRCRGVVTATKADGSAIVPTTTAGKAPKAKAVKVEAPVEAEPELVEA